MQTFIRLLFIAALFAISTLPALSSSLTIPAEDSGFYNSVGRHSKLDGSPSFGMATPATFNYSVGTIDEGPPFGPPGIPPDVFRKNFFTFDLSGVVSNSIAAATLKLFLPPGGYSNGISPTLTYNLHGTLGSPAAMATFSTDLKGVYDPGIGPELAKALSLYGMINDTKTLAIPPFGSAVVGPAAAGTTIFIPLTPPGIFYLAMYAGGDAVIGGELAGLPTTGPPDDPPIFLFGFTSPVIPGVVPWSMATVTPTPTPELELTLFDPVLTITPASSNTATVSWTPAIPGAVLQETLSLDPTGWTNSLSGATNPVTISTSASALYYRVHKP